MPDTNPAPALSASTETRSKTTRAASSGDQAATQRADVPRSAHFILQGKGGVGKSLVASLVAQYLADQGRLEGCFDTDPVNGSLQTIPALKAKAVELLAGDQLNVKGVDRLVESIVSAKSDIVVDNGAASFLPLSRYLVENDIPTVLSEHGASMVLHTVVTGGGNGLDTLKGLDALVGHFVPGAAIVVWVNEFFGPARFDGTDFEDTNVYKEHASKLRGMVYLRKLDPVMFAPNLAAMLERHMTFAEAAASDDFMLMEKSRLFRVKTDIWKQLETVL
jgi:hypothetical protein